MLEQVNAQDYINALVQQREAALNQVARVMAENADLTRRLAAAGETETAPVLQSVPPITNRETRRAAARPAKKTTPKKPGGAGG